MINTEQRKKYILARRIDDMLSTGIATAFALAAALVAALFDDKGYALVCMIAAIIGSIITVYLICRVNAQISVNITQAEKYGDIIEF